MVWGVKIIENYWGYVNNHFDTSANTYYKSRLCGNNGQIAQDDYNDMRIAKWTYSNKIDKCNGGGLYKHFLK